MARYTRYKTGMAHAAEYNQKKSNPTWRQNQQGFTKSESTINSRRERRKQNKLMGTHKRWTESEEVELLELYDRLSDKDEVFHAYKMKDSDRIGGRTVNAHVVRLRDCFDVVVMTEPVRKPQTRHTYHPWTLNNKLVLLEEINKNITAQDTISWQGIDLGRFPGHTRKALSEKWRHELRAMCKYNQKLKHWVSPELFKLKQEAMNAGTLDVNEGAVAPPSPSPADTESTTIMETPETTTTTTEVKSDSRTFVTVRKTYLWGLYKHEEIRHE